MNIYQIPKYVVEFDSETSSRLLEELSELLSKAEVSPEAYPALSNLDALIRKESNIIPSAKMSEW